MKKWKMPKEMTNVEEPKFFIGCMYALPPCLLFWGVVLYLIFG